MIRLRDPHDSIVAQLVFVSAFSHSLGHNRKLITLHIRLIKIGARVVRHGRYVTFQLAEVAVPRRLFREILRRINELRRRPAPA